ncbi:hypothetical protein [Flavobacteriaceae bacterium 14752]|uniref:hypothetical protein n=1 Tax=Mesohalobacter salilacus TaxID=2491711 RepID=UPI000F641F65|nr:hypothetical protein EIG84_06595 [Flavobacteriaceae bacterium 14752]
MKSIKFSLVFILGIIFLVSCSSDDDTASDINDDGNNDDNPVTEVENYFPLVVGNSWDYENTLSSPNQQDVVTNETLSIFETTEFNGSVVYELETDNPAGSGPATLALSQGTLVKDGSVLFYTGEFGLGLNNFPEVNFEIENAAIYNTAASTNAELFSQDGTIEQEFQGIPLSINYTLSTVMGNNFDTFESNGVTYDNVISSQLIVNLEIIANITDPLPISIPILQSQDGVIVTNYFADGIGLVESETNTNLMFEDIPIPGFQLDNISFNTLQVLTDFSITLE